MTSHAYAVEIENIIESVFNDPNNPLVCADLIEKYPYQYMIATLAHIYTAVNNDDIKDKIKQFDEMTFIFADMSIGTILSFNTSSNTVNGSEYTIPFKNGEKAIKTVINSFKVLCTVAE